MKLTIRTLEEITARTWPALETHIDDGWLLRYSAGYTRRANSVLPVYGSTRDVHDKIATCEAFYRRHHLPTVFKLTPVVYPDNLDRILAMKGYVRSNPPVSVQTCVMAYNQSQPDARVTLMDTVTPAWLDAYTRLNAIQSTDHPTFEQMLARGSAQSVYALITLDGQPAAVGMGQSADGYFGLFGIVTAQPFRRRGLARALVSTLLHHARTHHAHTTFLQVTADNVAARRLYAELGFCEVYPYWYRSRETT